MSVARGGQNAGHYYSNITKPYLLNINFIVDATNGNGLGIRSLKSNGWVNNVFMHTSSTPGSNNGRLNPNPVVGYAMVQFKQNFNYYLGGFSGFVSPSTGSASNSVTNHNVYYIATLGTTTLAQWLAAGVPPGVTPAVGVAFVAIATGAMGGTGTAIAAGNSGISSVEVIGDPNASIANSSIAANSGAIVIVQFLAATSSSVTTAIPTNPANNSVVGMSFLFDGSSVTIDGL